MLPQLSSLCPSFSLFSTQFLKSLQLNLKEYWHFLKIQNWGVGGEVRGNVRDLVRKPLLAYFPQSHKCAPGIKKVKLLYWGFLNICHKYSLPFHDLLFCCHYAISWWPEVLHFNGSKFINLFLCILHLCL